MTTLEHERHFLRTLADAYHTGRIGETIFISGPVRKPKGTRVWVMFGSAPVRVTVPNKGTLKLREIECRDGGHEVTTITIWREGDIIRSTVTITGNDCDGRYLRRTHRWCHVRRITAVLDEHSGVRWPEWGFGKSERRDYRAEAMGY